MSEPIQYTYTLHKKKGEIYMNITDVLNILELCHYSDTKSVVGEITKGLKEIRGGK